MSTSADLETGNYANIQAKIENILKTAGAYILGTTESNVYYDVGPTQTGEKHCTNCSE